MVRQCPACEGTGQVEYCPRHDNANCPCTTVRRLCPECSGDGEVLDDEEIEGPETE